MNKKTIALIITVASIAILGWTAILYTWNPYFVLNLRGNVNLGMGANEPHYEVHSTITFIKNGEITFSQYNAGEVTWHGQNQTLFKIFGNASWAAVAGTYAMNVSWISIGNKGSLDQTSDVLPGEWNRTAATISKNTGQSILNISCTFKPNAGGPYTADCIGLNWKSSGSDNLWAYDTFTEVTGIDPTFTVNVEFKVTVSS